MNSIEPNCDWCGESLITNPTEMPVRLASGRSAATSKIIGIDVTLTLVTTDKPAMLHPDCQETIVASCVMQLAGMKSA